jgi:hypothetical protein
LVPGFDGPNERLRIFQAPPSLPTINAQSPQILAVSRRVVGDRVIWKLSQDFRTQDFSVVFTVFRVMSRTRIPVPDAVFFEPKYRVTTETRLTGLNVSCWDEVCV